MYKYGVWYIQVTYMYMYWYYGMCVKIVWGKLYKIKSDQAISFQFLIAPIHPLFVFSRYIIYIFV